MILDLQPVIRRLSDEDRLALYAAAAQAGLSVGNLVKRWIQERLEGKEAA